MTDQGADESTLLNRVFLRSWFFIGDLSPGSTDPSVRARVVTITFPAQPEAVVKRATFSVTGREDSNTSGLSVDEVDQLFAALGVMQAKFKTLRNDASYKGEQQEILFTAKDSFEVRCTSTRLFVQSGRAEFETLPAGLDAFRELVGKCIEQMKAAAPVL